MNSPSLRKGPGPSPESWRGKKVFLTGHTGFKGSWLAKILESWDAEVFGYSLAPETSPAHFENLKWKIHSEIADIRDPDRLAGSLKNSRPDVVFHLAAQPLVLRSYENPRETYETNVMGTLNLLEAVRATPTVKAVVVVTSDKAYENIEEDSKAYVESDPMGGYDPYSSSKGCAEILTASYRRSFFESGALVASVRAGNVIGGGDWAGNRLIPDFARAYKNREKVVIRNMGAVRPWQHVLEPLSGYLMLAERLLGGDRSFAKAWNFGPTRENCVPVGEILQIAKEKWCGFDFETTEATRHEAKFLMLDSTLARRELSWLPHLDVKEAVTWTLDWYRSFIDSDQVLTETQITNYFSQ